MPKQYEAIRDRLIAQGLREAAAKKSAARIYNSQHPNKPVTNKHKAPPKRSK
jgi:hypothetical protein